MRITEEMMLNPSLEAIILRDNFLNDSRVTLNERGEFVIMFDDFDLEIQCEEAYTEEGVDN